MNEPSTAWQARYGEDAGDLDVALTQWNPLLRSLLDHRSVRSYADRPLPPGTVPLLIAAAQSASSSSNLQAWSVVAVEDAGRRGRLAELAGGQAHVRKAPLFLVWLADLARLERLGERQGTPSEGLEYLESLLIGVIDAALAAQNAVVALESLGLSCVYIGGIRNQPAGVAAELGLPPKVFPVFGLCVGYEDPRQPAAVKPRLPQAAVLHHEQYSLEAQDAAVDRYDAIMADFYRSQGMAAPDWSRHSVRRVRDAAALGGREHLVEVLKRMGFGLR